MMPLFHIEVRSAPRYAQEDMTYRHMARDVITTTGVDASPSAASQISFHDIMVVSPELLATAKTMVLKKYLSCVVISAFWV